MVNAVSAVQVFQSFSEFVRRKPTRQVQTGIVKAELKPLESSSVEISQEARRRLAEEQASTVTWDWEL
jgi:hypothetical protein